MANHVHRRAMKVSAITDVRDVRRVTWSARGVLTGNLRISGNFLEVTASAAQLGSASSASVPKAVSFKRQRVSGGRCRLYLPPSVSTTVMYLRQSSLLVGTGYPAVLGSSRPRLRGRICPAFSLSGVACRICAPRLFPRRGLDGSFRSVLPGRFPLLPFPVPGFSDDSCSGAYVLAPRRRAVPAGSSALTVLSLRLLRRHGCVG